MAIKCPPSKAPAKAQARTKEQGIRGSDTLSFVKNKSMVQRLGKSMTIQDAIHQSADQYHKSTDDINSGKLGAPMDMYETPMPLAIWAQVATRISEAGSVYVPFAGNGNLVFMADPNKNVQVNDTDANRAKNLRKYGYHKVTSKNALSNDMQIESQAEVVMVNPPVTPEMSDTNKPVKQKVGEMLVNTKIAKDYTTTRSDLVGAFLALDKLDQAHGRAFVMVRRDKKNANVALSKYLTANKFKMQQHLVLEGGIYTKGGRPVPMEVFVIDQTSKGGARLKVISNLDQLSVEGMPDPDLSAARTQAQAVSSEQARSGKEWQQALNTKKMQEEQERRARELLEAEAIEQGHPPPLEKDVKEKVESKSTHALQWIVDKFGSMITLASELNRRHDVKKGPDGQTVRVLPINVSTHGNGLSDNPNARFPHKLAGAHIEAQNDFISDVEKDGAKSVEEYVAKYTGSHDKDIPYLTKEQLMEVGMSIRNHRLGKSIVVGSQTGMGKGRVMAMMAKYAIKQGMKPVMVTQGSHLYLATARDMQAVKAWEASKVKGRSHLLGLATNKGDDVSVLMGDLDAVDYSDQKVVIKGGREVDVEEIFRHQDNQRLEVAAEIGGKSKEDAKKAAAQKALPLNLAQYDFVVTTYDQMQPVSMKNVKERRSERVQRHRLLRQLSQDGFYLFDESHLAGGSIQSMDEGSESVALYVRGLINDIYDHRARQVEINRRLAKDKKLKEREAKKKYGLRVRATPHRRNGFMFASATFLKNSTSMSLYRGLGFEEVLNEKQLRTPSFIDRLFGRYGGLNREQVAIMMVRDGTYIRSENSWEGTTVSHETADTDPTKTEEISNIISAFFRMSEALKHNMIEPLKDELEKSPKDELRKEGEYLDGISKIASEQAGKGEYRNVAKISFTEFGSTLHQLLAVLETAQKVDKVIEMAEKGIAEGKRVVIGLDHTNDAIINELIEMNEINSETGSDINMTDVFKRLVNSRMLRIKYHYYTGKIVRNKKGDITTDTEEDYIELTPQLMEQFGIWSAYNDVRDAIDESENLQDLPLSPIDYLRHNLDGKSITLNKSGRTEIKTGEITGRDRRLLLDKDGGWIYKQRSSKETGPKGKRRVADNFQNRHVNVVIINRSGSTGIDLHADEKAKNNEQRQLIMMESLPGLVNNVQMVGRVGRYGQIWNPDIKFVWMNTPGGQRQKAMTEEGFKSIGATSSGQVETPLVEREQAIEAEHIRGWYGDAAAVIVMRALEGSKVPVLEQMGLGHALKPLNANSEEREHRGIRNRLLMRLAALRPEWQARILERLDTETSMLVSRARAEGTYAGERLDYDGKVEYVEGSTYVLGHAHRQAKGRHSSFRESAMVSDFTFTATFQAETKADVVRHLAAVIAAKTGQDYDSVINEAHGMKKGAEDKYHNVEEEKIDWEAMDKAIDKLRSSYKESIELWGDYDIRNIYDLRPEKGKSMVGESGHKWVEELLAQGKVGEKEIKLNILPHVSQTFAEKLPFSKFYMKQIDDAVRRMKAFDRRHRHNVQRYEEMSKMKPPKNKRANLIYERRLKRLADSIDNYEANRAKRIEGEVKKFERIDWEARKWMAVQSYTQFGDEVEIKEGGVRESHAYVLGVKHTSISEGGNPLSPNDWSLEVIGSNKRRRYTIPMNLTFGRNAEIEIKAAEGELSHFKRTSLREGKPKRHPIITGNMLRAINFLNRQKGLAAKSVPIKVRMGDSDVFIEGIRVDQSETLTAEQVANLTELPVTDANVMMEFFLKAGKLSKKVTGVEAFRMRSAGLGLNIKFHRAELKGGKDGPLTLEFSGNVDNAEWQDIRKQQMFQKVDFAKIRNRTFKNNYGKAPTKQDMQEMDVEVAAYNLENATERKQALALLHLAVKGTDMAIESSARKAMNKIMGAGSAQSASIAYENDRMAKNLAQNPEIEEELHKLLELIAPFAHLKLEEKEIMKYHRDEDVHKAVGLFYRHKGWFLDEERGRIVTHAENLIRVALRTPYDDPVHILGHEAIHALRKNGLFTEQEWAALIKEMHEHKWMERYNIEERYPYLDKEGQHEEAIAEGFGEFLHSNWRISQRTYSPTTRTVFQRMIAFFKYLSELLQRFVGTDSAMINIFTKVMSGEVGRRDTVTDENFESEIKASAVPPRGKKEWDKEAEDVENGEQKAEFVHETVEKVYHEARTGREEEDFTKPSTWIKPVLDTFRYLKHIPQGDERYVGPAGKKTDWYSEFGEKWRHVTEVNANAQKMSEQYVKDFYEGLSREEATIANVYIILSDMTWQIEHDFKLPSDLSKEEVLQELDNFTMKVQANPRLKQKIELRSKLHERLRKELVESGFLPEDVELNENYFRHDVLAYSKESEGIRKRKLRKAGFAQRESNAELYNMNVAQVDFATYVDAHTKIEISKYGKWMKESKYNIKEENTRVVKNMNSRRVALKAVDELQKKLIDAGFAPNVAEDIIKNVEHAESFQQFKQLMKKELLKYPKSKVKALYKEIFKDGFIRGHNFMNVKISDAFKHLRIQAGFYKGEYPESFPKHVVIAMNQLIDAEGDPKMEMDENFYSSLTFIANNDDEVNLKAAATSLLAAFNKRRRYLQSQVDGYVDLRDAEKVNIAAGNGDTHIVWQIGAKDGERNAMAIESVKRLPAELVAKAEALKKQNPSDEAMKDVLDLIEHAPKVLAMGGPLEQVVIPIGMGKQLDHFFDEYSSNAYARAWIIANTTLKKHLLFFPTNTPTYFINNRSGDADFLIISRMFLKVMKGAVTELGASHKNFWKDWDTLKQFFMEGKTDDPLVKEALRMGVLQAGFFVHEIDVVRNYDPSSEGGMWATLGAAPKVLDDFKIRGPGDVVKAVWRGYKGLIRWIQKWNQLWESTLRFRTFKILNKEIREMIDNGASREDVINKYKLRLPTDPAAIRGIKETGDVVARYARDTLGDYGRASELTEFLKRNYIGYFHSFVETIFRRYGRIIANSLHTLKYDIFNPESDRKLEASKEMFYLWSRVVLMHTAVIYMISPLLSDDDDRKEIENELNRLMIPLSDWDGDGYVEMVRAEGALSPMLQWLGGKPVAEWAEDYDKGYAGLADLPGTVGWHYFNMLFRHANPFTKMSYELLAGHKTFPRFETDRPITDPVKHVLDIVDMSKPYNMFNKYLRNQPSPDRPFRPVMMAQFLLKEHNIGEQLYWEQLRDQNKWRTARYDLDKTGGGYSQTPYTKLFKKYERALIMKDLHSAELAMHRLEELDEEYRAQGKHHRKSWQNRLNSYIQGRAPLTDRRVSGDVLEYMNTLNDEQIAKLEVVSEWFASSVWLPHREMLKSYRAHWRRR